MLPGACAVGTQATSEPRRLRPLPQQTAGLSLVQAIEGRRLRRDILRAPAGQIFADVELATMRRKSCRFFWFCHEALWPLLRATKRLVASASPSGRYFAAGCGHEGNTDNHKLDGTQPTGFVGVFFLVACFGETKPSRPALSIAQTVLGNPGGAVPRCCLTPHQQESTFISAAPGDIVRQLDANMQGRVPQPT